MQSVTVSGIFISGCVYFTSQVNNSSCWFQGYLKYSYLFYGYYGNAPIIGEGYRLPLAYFLAGLSTYGVSFIVILRRFVFNIYSVLYFLLIKLKLTSIWTHPNIFHSLKAMVAKGCT